MKIYLKDIAKRYDNHWIFRSVSLTFVTGRRYALLGANGSGKSTLLRIIGGIQGTSKGELTYVIREQSIPADRIYRHISFAAPGMEIIEELSLREFLDFHFSFKKIRSGMTVATILALLRMEKIGDRLLSEFSSGMKQRVKLAQAFFTDTPVLLLDEPCSNLDQPGVELYQSWLADYSDNRIVIIASNDEREYPGAQELIAMEDYKK